jgi:dTDP-4-dehydrorhamnose reductase
MRLLITGCYGQVGTELIRLSSASGWEVKGVGRDTLDIVDGDAVSSLIRIFRPEAVINAAAYTAVDKAESEKETAFAANRDGPKNLADMCEKSGIPLIHISSDYVFDGTKLGGAYAEDDPIGPLGIYGESKAAGEEAVRYTCSRHIILRTSWVFSSHGNNFVKTMLRLGAERTEIGVVADQYGCPTSARELARVIYSILDHDADWGTYHCAQPDSTTWYGFAQAIFDEAGKQNMKLAVNKVKPITTKDYPTPAPRPANSVLCCDRLQEAFAINIRPWSKSLVEVIRELKGV